MGTDIHMAVETFDGERWVSATEFADEYGEGYFSPKSEVYGGRNYALFSILAGVRNGRGFAGVKTGDGFNVIAEPRGVPDDASSEVFKWMSQGDHTPSWLTVAEMMAFDWTQTTTLQGVVTLKEWARWKGAGEPDAYAGGVSGPRVNHHPAETVEATWESIGSPPVWDLYWERGDGLARLASALGDGDHYTSVRWNKLYSECCTDFLGNTMPKLWRLGKPEHVRICFWFDS